MRALALAAMLLLSGCVAPGLTSTSLELELPELPEGATVQEIEGGLRLVFDALDLPFERNFTVPEGATLVTARAVGDALVQPVTLRHAESLRRRCNFAPYDAWDARVTQRGECSGVTLVDRLPTTWQVRALAPFEGARVEVDILTTPLDGPLAQLDTTQLSMRDFEVAGTETMMVPSFDGTPLHVQVTLPQGPGPWPTVHWSSPYSHGERVRSPELPVYWEYWVKDWTERGYAAVVSDVRGYGLSEGCVEVWGPNEQRDQAFLVDWIAKQPWSDGNVAVWGQSYVGTTAIEAAVQAPEALKAIIAVAPVMDTYNDWHFGGVPNGETQYSPLGYQGTGGGVDPLDAVFDPAGFVTGLPGALPYARERVDNGYCDPTLALRATDPRAIYSEFYAERNLSARAADIEAAVLYTQGFQDRNVKSAMILHWFNEVQAPKLGLFGQWDHRHPSRADNEALFLLWLDQHVKGRPVGFERLPPVLVTTNDGRERGAQAWPAPSEAPLLLHLDPAAGALSAEPGDGFATILMDSARGFAPVSLADLPMATVSLPMESAPLAAPARLSGQGVVHVEATLQHAQNAYVAAGLYEVRGDERLLVTFGWSNVAHREGHDQYDPVAPGERVRFAIPLLPIEWTFAEGSTLVLDLHGVAVQEWALTPPTEPGALDVYADGSLLELPNGEMGEPMPATARR